MILLPNRDDEERRLEMLATLEFIDGLRDGGLDGIAELARDLAGSDVALVSLVDREDVRFAGAAGFVLPSICRWDSFCNHAIVEPRNVLWIEDASLDARFHANPYVVGEPFLRFYAGVPIRVNDCVVGTLCVLNPAPRAQDADLERQLRRLAGVAESILAERHRTNATRRALTASADGLIDCDAHGVVLNWSDGAETLFGYSRAEALGANVAMIVPPELRDAHTKGMEQWRQSGAARLGRRLELPAMRKSGEVFDIELWMSVSQSDGAAHVHANIRDISERKAQSRDLVVAKAEAEAANHAKTAFLANMSHELRTPLNGVVAAADMLAATNLSANQTELTDIVRASSQQLESLIADILDLARIESGELQLSAEPVAIGGLVQDVLSLCGLKAAEKGVALAADIAPEADRTVLTDAVRVKQVLTNLISNAVKFTDQGSIRVMVTRNSPGGAYRFEVRDTGIGFHPEQRDLIFGRFQQADNTVTRRFGGTGLGLAISRDLVTAMGGALDCAGRPGEGAIFWFDLPLPDAVCAGEAHASARRSGDLSSARILIVDDNATNRRVAELILHTAGVATHSAEDGVAALAALADQTYDLVLMDMMMPVMDGMTAVRTLREREAASGLARTPVVMLTANSLPDHIEASLTAGADRHLAKPISPAGLLTAVAEMLELSAVDAVAASGDAAA